MVVLHKKQTEAMANKSVRRRRKLTFLYCVFRQLNLEGLGSSESEKGANGDGTVCFFF